MPGSILRTLTHNLTTLSSVAYDLVRLLVLGMRSRRKLAATNLYLRKQLALSTRNRSPSRNTYSKESTISTSIWRTSVLAISGIFPRKPDLLFDPCSVGGRLSLPAGSRLLCSF